jgi:hypothetical protein
MDGFRKRILKNVRAGLRPDQSCGSILQQNEGRTVGIAV